VAPVSPAPATSQIKQGGVMGHSNAETHRSNQRTVALGILAIAACVASIWLSPLVFELF
jgi:hypothetical protein